MKYFNIYFDLIEVAETKSGLWIYAVKEKRPLRNALWLNRNKLIVEFGTIFFSSICDRTMYKWIRYRESFFFNKGSLLIRANNTEQIPYGFWYSKIKMVSGIFRYGSNEFRSLGRKNIKKGKAMKYQKMDQNWTNYENLKKYNNEENKKPFLLVEFGRQIMRS